jgi:hypothetical protein
VLVELGVVEQHASLVGFGSRRPIERRREPPLDSRRPAGAACHRATLAGFWPHNGAQRCRLLRVWTRGINPWTPRHC